MSGGGSGVDGFGFICSVRPICWGGGRLESVVLLQLSLQAFFLPGSSVNSGRGRAGYIKGKKGS